MCENEFDKSDNVQWHKKMSLAEQPIFIGHIIVMTISPFFEPYAYNNIYYMD